VDDLFRDVAVNIQQLRQPRRSLLDGVPFLPLERRNTLSIEVVFAPHLTQGTHHDRRTEPGNESLRGT
jgi:hypothetical protein